MYLIVFTVCFTKNIKSKEKILDATQQSELKKSRSTS